MKKTTLALLAGPALSCCLLAQNPAPTTAPASTEPTPPAATPAPAPAAPVWSVGSMDFSGYIDGYYSYDANRPSNAANGQTNDFYNFNDKTDQFNLSAAKFTINHDPDPVGVHVDLIWGRTNTLIHSLSDQSTNYIEQAYISAKPPKFHGTELDFGQFVTSAGAEVIEAKDNWNYSRSLLFVYALPYYHFGVRTATPITASWTAGVQIVNGWNNVVDNNGGVTFGLTSAVTKPKFGWAFNYYTGPENNDTQKGYRNLIDSTVTLTPTSKFTAYINYDYLQNHFPPVAPSKHEVSDHLSGIALAAKEAITGKASLAGRFEFFHDNEGFSTGTAQRMKEFTGTYEYKWAAGLLSRVEYRHDWSDQAVYHKGNTELVKGQSTITVAFIAFFGPKR